MTAGPINSIAARIAIAIVTAIICGVMLTLALGIGNNYRLDRRATSNDAATTRIFVDRFGIAVFNRQRNMQFVSARIATLAQALGKAQPGDRAVVMAAISDDTIHGEIRDAPTLGPAQNGAEASRLDALIALQLGSEPNAIRIGTHLQNMPADDVLVEIRLPDAKWLAVTLVDFHLQNGLPPLLVVLFVGLAILITLLSIWTARRLTRPISAFAVAAERFGISTEAVPLAESGPQELRAATRAFNQMQDRLRRFISDRTQMVAAMSHDLKTPLTRLRLRVELIRDKVQQHKMMADLDEMTAMIESTLAFVRDDAKREAPLLVDLGALVESVCENAIDAGGVVEVAARQGVNVTCRPAAISRAIANLIDNALKYGGCARVSLDQFDGRVVVTVDDDGPGIPDEEREKVFAPFYRIESSRNRDTGGVGLGLAVARTTAREHGGDVHLARAASGGLRVQLELPLVDAVSLRPLPDKACA